MWENYTKFRFTIIWLTRQQLDNRTCVTVWPYPTRQTMPWVQLGYHSRTPNHTLGYVWRGYDLADTLVHIVSRCCLRVKWITFKPVFWAALILSDYKLHKLIKTCFFTFSPCFEMWTLLIVRIYCFIITNGTPAKICLKLCMSLTGEINVSNNLLRTLLLYYN